MLNFQGYESIVSNKSLLLSDISLGVKYVHGIGMSKLILQVLKFYAFFYNKSSFRGQKKTGSGKKEHVLLNQW